MLMLKKIWSIYFFRDNLNCDMKLNSKNWLKFEYLAWSFCYSGIIIEVRYIMKEKTELHLIKIISRALVTWNRIYVIVKVIAVHIFIYHLVMLWFRLFTRCNLCSQMYVMNLYSEMFYFVRVIKICYCLSVKHKNQTTCLAYRVARMLISILFYFVFSILPHRRLHEFCIYGLKSTANVNVNVIFVCFMFACNSQSKSFNAMILVFVEVDWNEYCPWKYPSHI